jgi:DNA repair protein RecN (Recombination protein N)
MEGARFAVEFQTQPSADGCYVTLDGAAQRLAFDQTGFDRVEFLISANPGEPPKPLVKVASGGETARLMLALKTALAQVDETPTLIFDEIDQGIGGRVGDIVGRKLWGLARGRPRSSLLPTCRSWPVMGTPTYLMSAAVAAGRTTTHVDAWIRPGACELAAMLGTQGDTAVSGAESILHHVEQTKVALPIEECVRTRSESSALVRLFKNGAKRPDYERYVALGRRRLGVRQNTPCRIQYKHME